MHARIYFEKKCNTTNKTNCLSPIIFFYSFPHILYNQFKNCFVERTLHVSFLSDVDGVSAEWVRAKSVRVRCSGKV